MIEIIIMRHAKSDWNNHLSDKQRPLNNRGSNDAILMGEHLAKLALHPNKLIVSSAKRTQQTANLLLNHLNIAEEKIFIEDSLYLASINTLLNTMKTHAEENIRLMILAHNPGVDELISYLASTQPPLTASGKLMTTCAAAIFEIESIDNLNKPRIAKLTGLYRPKEIG